MKKNFVQVRVSLKEWDTLNEKEMQVVVLCDMPDEPARYGTMLHLTDAFDAALVKTIRSYIDTLQGAKTVSAE